jgi:hypothetical protein
MIHEELGGYDLAEHDAYREQRQQQQAAQREIEALQEAQHLQERLPSDIAEALGNRPGSAEAAGMLSDDVAAVAEEMASEALAGLLQRGVDQQTAMAMLARDYPALIQSATALTREVRGSREVLDAMRQKWTRS